MVYYKCDKCKYTTTRKCDYIKHLNRKNQCISKDSKLVTNYEKTQLAPKSSEIGSEKLLFSPKIPILDNNEYDCIYCGKSFLKKSNLTRHMKSNCKIMKSQMTLMESEKSKWQDEKFEMQVKTIELEKKVEQLNKDLINKPTMNITNINTINNVKINNYGNENLGHLTIHGINKLIDAPYTAIPNIIKSIHYHPEHPENNNMKITNKRQPYIKILDDNKWRIDNKKKVISGLIERGN